MTRATVDLTTKVAVAIIEEAMRYSDECLAPLRAKIATLEARLAALEGQPTTTEGDHDGE